MWSENKDRGGKLLSPLERWVVILIVSTIVASVIMYARG